MGETLVEVVVGEVDTVLEGLVAEVDGGGDELYSEALREVLGQVRGAVSDYFDCHGCVYSTEKR